MKSHAELAGSTSCVIKPSWIALDTAEKVKVWREMTFDIKSEITKGIFLYYFLVDYP